MVQNPPNEMPRIIPYLHFDLKGVNQGLYVYVEDVDRHHESANFYVESVDDQGRLL